MTRRFYVAFTKAQLEAAMEAMTSRLAGPLEGSDQPLRTYEAAEDALCRPAEADVAIFLSKAEALALQALVGYAQGACEGEPDMIRIYRKPPAERASNKLDAAIAGGDRS